MEGRAIFKYEHSDLSIKSNQSDLPSSQTKAINQESKDLPPQETVKSGSLLEKAEAFLGKKEEERTGKAVKNPIRWALLLLSSIPLFAIGLKVAGLNGLSAAKNFGIFIFIILSSMEATVKSARVEGEQKITVYAIAVGMMALGTAILILR